MIKRLSTRFHTLFEQVRDPFLFVEPDGKIRDANPAARAVLDLGSRGQVQDVCAIDGSFRFDAKEIMRALARERPVYGLRMRDAEGNSSDVTVDILDLGRKRGESGMRVIHIKDASWLRDHDRWSDDKVTLVAHEIKNPLAAIKSSIGILLSQAPGQMTNEQNKLLATSMRSIDRLTRLVEGFLDVSKASVGGYVPRPAWVDARQYLGDVVSSFKTLSNPKGLAIDLRVSAELDSVFIDAAKLEQVLINLLSNAVRFSHEQGAIEVAVDSAGVETLDDDLRILPWRDIGSPRFVRVIVRDSGIGMNEDTLSNLFARHYSTRSSEVTGSHLGLSICKTLVEVHHGGLDIKSELGVGTEVTVYLPRDEVTFNLLARIKSIGRCLARAITIQKGGYLYALRKDESRSWGETIGGMRMKPVIDPDLDAEQSNSFLGWPLGEDIGIFLLIDDDKPPAIETLFGVTINAEAEWAHHVEGHTTARCRVPAEGTRVPGLLNLALKRLKRPAPVWSRA